jgi:hypothetical protein
MIYSELPRTLTRSQSSGREAVAGLADATAVDDEAVDSPGYSLLAAKSVGKRQRWHSVPGHLGFRRSWHLRGRHVAWYSIACSQGVTSLVFGVLSICQCHQLDVG